MKILHVIIGLDVGGAEMMLKRLMVAFQQRPDCSNSVVSLTGIGKVGEQLQSLGIEVEALGMRSALDMPRVLLELVGLIRRSSPDIVQSWMYHADLLGGLAARMAGCRNVIWGVRGSAIPQGRFSATQFVVLTCAALSRFVPSAIVCCAESARDAHARLGYHRAGMLVIENGYDLWQFQKSDSGRRRAREAFGLSETELVIGMVGRFDPLKDYRNFTRAAAVVAGESAEARFLLVGRGMDRNNGQLDKWIGETGHPGRFILAGERDDVRGCLACFDVFCLSSLKEGFPNAVCEAMAMGVPCVVTAAGDAGRIVSDTGLVVRPGDPAALAEALLEMVRRGEADRLRLGKQARRRIEDEYSIETASRRFAALYQKINTSAPGCADLLENP